MENKDINAEHVHHWCGCSWGNYGWGLFIVLLGLYFLATDQGWIPSDFPLWQVLLIVFGSYLLINNRRRKY